MDKVTAMHTFLTVAKLGSFAEAARQLGVSRSQTNRMVNGLEDELGVTLFNRTTRELSLTPTGLAYRERAQQLLDDLLELEQSVQSSQDQPTGEIKINAPMSFGTLYMASAVSDFMAAHPQVRVYLFLSDEKLDPVSSGFDITVRISEPKDSPAYIEHGLSKAHRVLCCSPAFLEQFPEPKHPEDLKSLPCLHYGNLPSGHYWKFEQDAHQMSIKVDGPLCSNNAEVLKAAALAGQGIALIPKFVAKTELETGALVPVLSEFATPEIMVNLLYTPSRHLSARMRLFILFMQARFESLKI